uniref:Putative aminoacyl trna synthetase complex-interacting multifunctional protein 2 n=1 Tax=Amblyomma triste TaxID=251400 RepID=A0A023GKW9_AMBTT
MASVPAGCMYRIKPIYEEIASVEIPTCMYRVPSMYGETCTANVPNGEVPNNTQDLVAELEQRQQQLLERLSHLKKLVENIKPSQPHKQQDSITMVSAVAAVSASAPMLADKRGGSLVDVVVSASPDNPPWSLWPLHRLLSRQKRVLLSCHTHSSVNGLPSHLSSLAAGAENGILSGSRTSYDLALTLVWKKVDWDCEVMVSPLLQTAIVGEVNLIRYLGRLLSPSYESADAASVTDVDHWLSLAHHGVIHGKNKEQQAVLKALNAQLGKTPYILGSTPGLADIALWSALLQANLSSGAPSNVKTWLKALAADPFSSCPSAMRLGRTYKEAFSHRNDNI